jgi:hypothetical protein
MQRRAAARPRVVKGWRALGVACLPDPRLRLNGGRGAEEPPHVTTYESTNLEADRLATSRGRLGTGLGMPRTLFRAAAYRAGALWHGPTTQS